MFSSEERLILRENGFVEENGYEIEVYKFGDWTICKSMDEVDNVVESYIEGCRVCWMNEYRCVDGLEFVLVNVCDCGIWICGSVEECLNIIEEESEVW